MLANVKNDHFVKDLYIPEIDGPFPDTVISDEEKLKIKIVGEIIENYIRHHKIKDDGVIYGELFDKFFDKSISELVIYQTILGKDF